MTTPADIISTPLSSSTFTTAPSPTALSDTSITNSNLTQYLSSQSVSLASQAVNQTNPVNKNISYQILAEPLRAVSPNSIITAHIASLNTMAQGFLNPILSTLDNLSALSVNPSAINGSSVKSLITTAGQKATTVVQGHAVLGNLASGHSINVANAAHITSANAIHQLADTSASRRAPCLSDNSQDHFIQANNSYSVGSNIYLGQHQSKVELTMGTHVSQSDNHLNVCTTSHTTASNSTQITGVQTMSVFGGTTNIASNGDTNHVCGGNLNQYSYGNWGTQVAGSVGIMAGPTPATAATMATASSGSTSTTPVTGGGIYFISQNTANQATPSTISIVPPSSSSPGGIIQQTAASIIAASGQYNAVTSTQGTSVSSDGFSFVGSPQAGMLIKGGKVFVGNVVNPIVNSQAYSVVNPPTVPTIPKLPSAQLANCIPKQFTQAKTNGTFSSSTGSSEGTILTTNPNGTSTTSTGSTNSTAPTAPGLNNPKQQAALFTPSSTGTSSSNQLISALPFPSASSLASGTITTPTSTSFVDSAALMGGPPSIYPDAYTSTLTNPTSSTVTTALTLNPTQVGTTLTNSTATNATSIAQSIATQNLNDAAACAMIPGADFFTTANITSYLSPNVPAIMMSTLLYPQFYIDLIGISPLPTTVTTISPSSLPVASPTESAAIISIAQQYPLLDAAIISMLNAALTPAAIGLLGIPSNIGTLFNTGILSDISKLPTFLATPNVTTGVGLLSPIISPSLAGSPFSSLLSNPSLLGLGNAALAGTATQTMLNNAIDSAFNTTIKGVLTQQITSALGPNGPSIVTLTKDLNNLLKQVQLGKTVNASATINQIAPLLTGITGIQQITLANQIYQGLSGTIKAVATGNILNILNSSSVSSLLTSVLGAQNAGPIANVLNLAKSAYGTYQAIALLPKVLNLMNQYKIPAINQIGIALNCTGLMTALQNLLNSLGAFSTPQAAASLVENTPVLTQAANTINSVDPTVLTAWNTPVAQALGTTEPVDLSSLQGQLTIYQYLNTCFQVPTLNLYQSAVTVNSASPGAISFSLTNFSLFTGNYQLLPSVNGTIQVQVSNFYSSVLGVYLTPYQTDYDYTPATYNYIITQYDPIQNTGSATLDAGTNQTLVLQDPSGNLYTYYSTDIGNDLAPDISNAYILA